MRSEEDRRARKRAYMRRYYRRRRRYHIEKGTRWNRENRERRSEISHKHELKKFNLTPADYDRMLRAQHGKCAICGHDPMKRPRHGSRVRRLSVDHDHDTGRVRGLLCVGCNFRVAWYERLSTKIVGYLRRRRALGAR